MSIQNTTFHTPCPQNSVQIAILISNHKTNLLYISPTLSVASLKGQGISFK